jgi:hypothetical protein
MPVIPAAQEVNIGWIMVKKLTGAHLWDLSSQLHGRHKWEDHRLAQAKMCDLSSK